MNLHYHYISYITNSQVTNAKIISQKLDIQPIVNEPINIYNLYINLYGRTRFMIKEKIENGYYIFKLEDMLKERNVSINKLMRDTNTDFKVLKRLLTGELVRFDIFVMARLCDYFECTITDIVEYIPPENKVS